MNRNPSVLPEMRGDEPDILNIQRSIAVQIERDLSRYREVRYIYSYLQNRRTQPQVADVPRNSNAITITLLMQLQRLEVVFGFVKNAEW